MGWSRPSPWNPFWGEVKGGSHLSCLDCVHFETGSQPQRRCALNPEVFIQMCSGDDEANEDDGGMTRADRCDDYSLAPELVRWCIVVEEEFD